MVPLNCRSAEEEHVLGLHEEPCPELCSICRNILSLGRKDELLSRALYLIEHGIADDSRHMRLQEELISEIREDLLDGN